jgi:hypothetical protein
LLTAALVYAPAERRARWQVGAVVVLVAVLVGLTLIRFGQLPAFT